MTVRFAALASLALLAACSTPSKPTLTPVQDGEVALPAGYKAWPKFLSEVQRADVKQVREIYVNPTGYAARQGESYAHGTTFVMENWAAQVDESGTPLRGADGKLVRGILMRVFVMSKAPGNGSAAEVKNGDWAYGSYDAAGNKTADNLGACRACHLPLAAKDFVFRYDEHFAARAKGIN